MSFDDSGEAVEATMVDGFRAVEGAADEGGTAKPRKRGRPKGSLGKKRGRPRKRNSSSGWNSSQVGN